MDEAMTVGNRLVAIPESYRSLFQHHKHLFDNLGETRVIGSTVYDIALTATG